MQDMMIGVSTSFPLPADVKEDLEKAGMTVVEYNPDPVIEIEIPFD